MKLLVYGLNFAPELTGVGKYTGEMCDELAVRGHQIDVVTAPPYYPEWKVSLGHSGRHYRQERVDKGGGMLITRCPIWVPAEPGAAKRLLHLFSFCISSFPALFAAYRRKPDVCMLIMPTLFCAPAALILSKIFRVPVWAHVQDFEVEAMFSLGMGGKSQGLRRFAIGFESLLLKRFDRTSSISKKMVEKLAEKGVAQAAIAMLPNWVDMKAIHPTSGENHFRSMLGISSTQIVVLYAGNMGEKQGLDLVVELARQLMHRSDIRFVLAGAGAARDRLEAAAKDVSNIAWLPLQPMSLLNALLGAADIHVLPQRGGAADLVMPSKLTGMLASGRVTVGTAAPGTQLGEVLDKVGVRVDPEDIHGLVSAVQRLAADAETRIRLGMRGRQYAHDTMRLEPIIDRLEQDLQRLVPQHAHRSV